MSRAKSVRSACLHIHFAVLVQFKTSLEDAFTAARAPTVYAPMSSKHFVASPPVLLARVRVRDEVSIGHFVSKTVRELS